MAEPVWSPLVAPPNQRCIILEQRIGYRGPPGYHPPGTFGRGQRNMHRSATFSSCGRYRYVLRRCWQPDLPSVLFVALNPSTADAVSDDPTIRRCISFARRWGFGTLIVANLFALRATHPAALLVAQDPIGPGNDRWLRRLSQKSELTVAAWGMHGELHDRAAYVLPMLRSVHHLGRTRDGHPRHPLYLPGCTLPKRM